MKLETLIKIRSNSNLLQYLKENSYWYKYLNRNTIYEKNFENKMKEDYKLTTKDRMEKMADGIDTLSKILDILN